MTSPADDPRVIAKQTPDPEPESSLGIAMRRQVFLTGDLEIPPEGLDLSGCDIHVVGNLAIAGSGPLNLSNASLHAYDGVDFEGVDLRASGKLSLIGTISMKGGRFTADNCHVTVGEIAGPSDTNPPASALSFARTKIDHSADRLDASSLRAIGASLVSLTDLEMRTDEHINWSFRDSARLEINEVENAPRNRSKHPVSAQSRDELRGNYPAWFGFQDGASASVKGLDNFGATFNLAQANALDLRGVGSTYLEIVFPKGYRNSEAEPFVLRKPEQGETYEILSPLDGHAALRLHGGDATRKLESSNWGVSIYPESDLHLAQAGETPSSVTVTFVPNERGRSYEYVVDPSKLRSDSFEMEMSRDGESGMRVEGRNLSAYPPSPIATNGAKLRIIGLPSVGKDGLESLPKFADNKFSWGHPDCPAETYVKSIEYYCVKATNHSRFELEASVVSHELVAEKNGAVLLRDSTVSGSVRVAPGGSIEAVRSTLGEVVVETGGRLKLDGSTKIEGNLVLERGAELECSADLIQRLEAEGKIQRK